MGKTSTASKSAWNLRNYDSFLLHLKKGDRARLKSAAEAEGVSVNRLILDSINLRFPGLLSSLDDTRKKAET